MRVDDALLDEAWQWYQAHGNEAVERQWYPKQTGQIAGVPPKIMSLSYLGITITPDMTDFPSRSEIKARHWLICQLALPFLLNEEG